ncbi:hypothetical protein THAOC_12233 [Thalassiosira oceanica]|uniref:Uncharacterized protein n=1 Tax=Thalassiosira oceanica TaxID=159749 RepID=K0SN66_THAOC|nr:hypothetical protein THAOC_12233 [Thalassiosira oceanica]|eukprot:EJK66805.1 hypothetical protein THAOC_12233 [Thalassiosira oceanica]
MARLTDLLRFVIRSVDSNRQHSKPPWEGRRRVPPGPSAGTSLAQAGTGASHNANAALVRQGDGDRWPPLKSNDTASRVCRGFVVSCCAFFAPSLLPSKERREAHDGGRRGPNREGAG